MLSNFNLSEWGIKIPLGICSVERVQDFEIEIPYWIKKKISLKKSHKENIWGLFHFIRLFFVGHSKNSAALIPRELFATNQ